MTYQATVRRLTLVTAILVAIALTLFLVAPFGKGVPLAQASVENTPATGAPTIIGTAQVGETLAAGITGIADADGLTNVSYNYQWLADDADIAGATGSTYTPVDGDEGKAIKVQVSFTDDAGNDETLTSPATDAVAAAPQLNIAITSDPDDDDSTFAFWYDEGVYGIGDDIEVTVTFNGNVTVTGSPRLELTIGSSAKNAAYKSANGSKVVFGYTVAVGDNDTDGIAIGSNKLTLNGGSIRDAADNAANLSHGALSAQSGHKVDGIRPTITYGPSFAYSTFSNDGVHTIGEYISAYVRFSEEVIGIGVRNDGRPRLRIDMGGATRYARYHPLPINDWRDERLHFLYEVVEGDLDLDGISVAANSVELNGGTIRDAAGNDAVLTHSAVPADDNFIVDGVPPTVSSVTITSDPGDDDTYGVGNTIEVTVTFSEAVDIPQWRGTENGMTVTRMPRLELNIGGVAKSAKTHERENITGTAIVFRYTVQNGDNDSNGISISANKLTLNGGTIRDANGTSLVGGNPADLTHTAVADDADHKVDTTAGPQSADATLYRLTLRDIVLEHDYSYFYSGFRPAVVNYTASVAYSLAQTTVTPTANHYGASYVIKLGGVTDADGVVPLSVGSNVITIKVTAQDGETSKTYTVTVTRAAPVLSADATLSDLTLSGIDFEATDPAFIPPGFDDTVTSYVGSVANSVTQTTVTATTRHSSATYAVKLGGVTDADGTVSLAVGSNVITVEVTAEDGETTRTYTITVTRVSSDASTDATLRRLVLSDVDFGTFAPDTTKYTARVSSSVTETLVSPYVSHRGASYVVKLGGVGVTDFNRRISLAVGSNVITVEVTAEDLVTTKTYTITVTRAAASIWVPDLVVSSVSIDSSTFGDPSFTLHATVRNQGSGSSDSTTLRYYISFDSTITSRDVEIGTDAVGGLAASGSSAESIDLPSAPGTFHYGACVDTLSDELETTNNCSSVAVSVNVADPNSLATGAPIINGTAQVGQTLTADTSGIADSDGLTNVAYSYQWLADDTEIAGATGNTYALTSAELGKAIKVRVSFTDGAGNDETLTSTATEPIEAQADGQEGNSPATGLPTISGTAQVGETLTASITGIADADGLSGESFTYQWVSGDGTTDTDIENATGSTYKLVDADQGKAIKVRVTFTDGGGNEETLTSAPTGPVLGDGLPGAPRNLAATPGNKEVTLSWDPPADNGNAPATGYRIEWRVDGKDYENHWGTARSTTYTTNVNANLANGVKYFFRVKAGNGSGNSQGPYGPASGEVSATPTSGSAVDLGTPVLSNTENLHHGMVRLDWEDVEDAGWYVVQYYHVKGGEWLDLPAEGVDVAFHGSSAVVSDLHGLSWLRVGAMSCGGESEWSQIEQLFGTNASDWEGVPVPEVAEGDEIEPCPVVLGTPVLSDTETLHHGMVRLDWEDIEDAGWYVVQYYHVKGGEWLDLPAEGVDIAFHGSSAVVSNLHGLSWLRVRAMSCAGESEWSQIEQLFGTNASDWEGVPVPEVAEGDEIEPCSEDADTSDNSPATGAPTISGTAQVGETLEADTSGIADADGLTNVAFTYQWITDDSVIVASAARTYTPTDGDRGKSVKVRVSFTDDTGNPETRTSANTATVEARANSPATGLPTINGTAQVGQTLTANTSGVADADGLSNVQYEYQWLADDSGISGATNATYTLVAADDGKAIKVRVSFTDDAGNNEETLTSAATEAVAAAPTPNSPATGTPAISGTAQVGETLTANTSGVADVDGLSNVRYEYQWLADDAEIAGATGLTYTLAATDEGKAITVQVSFTDDADNEETLTSAATAAVASAPQSNSPATGEPTITGTVQVGETLTANTSGIADPDGLSNVQYEYQWLADDVDISGATNATYTLVAEDEGKAIKVRVSFADDAGNGETLTSAATDAVAAAPTPNTPATGAPTINGTAQVGEALTADTSGIADADGLSNVQYEYQWLADDAEIAGATGSTHTLADTDEGKAIKVEVTFTDDASNDESLTSAATDAVAAAEPAEPPAKPRGLSATATHDQVVLTWDDPGDDSITGYVILRRVRVNDTGGDFSVLVPDTGSAATTYTDDTVAASTTYTYRIKAINGAGTSERSRWVHIDIPAAPVPDKPTGLSATATHNSVTLTWNDPGDDSITGYVILRRNRDDDPKGHFDELVADTGTAATTYTDDTVAAGTSYTYRIKAINGAGPSERSRWSHIDTPAAP